MKTGTISLHGELRLPEKVHAFLGEIEKHAALCASPKKAEFKLCALMAAWEATALQDRKACHWYELWQKSCRRHHRGKVGRTLADPVNKQSLAARAHIPEVEARKARAAVKSGLRRVFRETVNHYSFAKEEAEGTGAPAILFEKIRGSFRAAESFACPEGLEFFLLTLIELFEQSLGADEDILVSHKAWLSEIRRRRSGGPPETRTLADVAPAEVRLKRRNALPDKDRAEILERMISSTRRITSELQSYLETRAVGKEVMQH